MWTLGHHDGARFRVSIRGIKYSRHSVRGKNQPDLAAEVPNYTDLWDRGHEVVNSQHSAVDDESRSQKATATIHR